MADIEYILAEHVKRFQTTLDRVERKVDDLADHVGRLEIAIELGNDEIEKNRLGQWCYFTGPNILNPEIVNRDLDALKVAVIERLRQ